jgi:hypothetical protein
MSNSGDNPDWWIDGVSVGSNPEAPPGAPPQRPAYEPTPAEQTPPRGVPATAPPTPGSPAGGVAAAGAGAAVAGAAAATWTAPSGPQGPTETLAPGSAEPSEEEPEKPRRRWPLFLLAAVILVGIIIVIIMLLTPGTPAYTVHHESTTYPISPTIVDVPFTVSNSGNGAGAPTCTVHLTTQTGANSGKGTFKLPQLPAGKGQVFIKQITVPKTTSSLMATSARITIHCK